ncbi:permease-like cell division protein FtsX [Actinoallomurus rhizosphaericola]|uniref:permease-like cell division protein FtsX n=1 Tax=Actinoallomurus rhizosphaericola TaxID=2952536 RepID=UPI002091E5D4|nr:permease-like cell division protein FtsX [Actinoallomurus rhizosphaericola]MCO5997562.1 permease-like cell division protein FtsX [Actinoallomurus rhizosphaericola]
MRSLEDRVRDAYSMADDWGPAVPPPLRRRSVRRRRLRFAAPLAAAVGVTTVVFLAAGLPRWTQGPAGHRANGPAAGSPRSTAEDQVRVYLCSTMSANPSCHHRDATEAQRTAIRHALEKVPGLQAIAYLTRAQAYAEAKNDPESSPPQSLRPEDFQDSFQVITRGPAGVTAITRTLAGRPGVDRVVTERR